jgi:hypothetical protein
MVVFLLVVVKTSPGQNRRHNRMRLRRYHSIMMSR